MESSIASTRMKCDLKLLWKAFYVPKFGGNNARAVICLSLAHLLAGVPILE